MTADIWDEEHKNLSEQIRSDLLPQLDLLVYSENWASIDARRKPPTRGTEETDVAWKQAIERGLEQRITVDFQELEIQEVVEFLQRNTDINFVLDPRVVAAGLVPPFSMQLDNITIASVLEFIMLQTDLRYTLEGQAVYISNPEGLRGDVFMRVYDIRDLTLGLTQFPGPNLNIPEPGGEGTTLIPEVEADDTQEIDDFIEIISEVVEPETWGNTIQGSGLDEWNGALVVTTTENIHVQVEELLRTLRNQQAVQINVKVRFLSVENSMLEEIGFDWNNTIGPPGSSSVWPVPGGAEVINGQIVTNPNPNIIPGGNPEFGSNLTPPYWLGGYIADRANNPSYAVAGQITNTLSSYQSDIGLDNTGGLTADLQLYEDPEGFFGSVLMRAVEKTRRGNIVISPDLTLMSGQRSHIVRMNQQAYISDYDVSGDSFDPVISVLSYGTVLDVEALASADRRFITLTLRPTTTEVERWRRFGGNDNGFGGSLATDVSSDGTDLEGLGGGLFPLTIPELRYRSVETSVTIPDGGSLMIAGMTSTISNRAHAGIPVLSHIPFLGRLFSKNGRAERQLKDLIFVTGDILIFDEIEERL